MQTMYPLTLFLKLIVIYWFLGPDLSYREWTARLFRMTTPEVIHELGSHSGYVMMNDRSYRQFNNIALEGSLYVDVNFYQPGTGAVEASPRLYVNW